MSIDWSKAPEGTNAYCYGYWLKRIEGEGCEFLMQPVNNGWEPVNFKPWKQDGFTYKEDDIKRQEEDEKIITEIADAIGGTVSRDTREDAARAIFNAGYRKEMKS